MFEAFNEQRRINRSGWVGLSALGHALLLAVAWRAFVVVQEAPPIAAQRVTFLSPPPPPPPPAAGGAKPKVKREIPRKIVPRTIQQPVEQQPVQPEEPAPEEGGKAGGVEGGVQGGVVGGVVGGTGPKEFDGRMTPPRLVSGPQIQYTEKALENDVEGLMIVRCVLTVTGEVKDCVVQQSVRFMDNAVVATLEKRRYTPVTLAGRPIEVYYSFRVRLNLPR